MELLRGGLGKNHRLEREVYSEKRFCAKASSGLLRYIAPMFPSCPIYRPCVLLYNGIYGYPKSPSHDTSSKPPSNKNSVLFPDKTGNNRHTVSETSNDPICPTSPLTNPSFQTFSNQLTDPSPDKTGNNRKTKLKKLNFGDPQCRSKRGC
jgi:hypothetical protein